VSVPVVVEVRETQLLSELLWATLVAVVVVAFRWESLKQKNFHQLLLLPSCLVDLVDLLEGTDLLVVQLLLVRIWVLAAGMVLLLHRLAMVGEFLVVQV
jgi:hypothetical protein